MDSTMEELYNACQVGLPVILFVQVFQKAGSSSQVHEEAEEAHEREGVDGVGEQQEEEEGDWEGDETSRGFVVTGFVDEREGNTEVIV
jgi:hypothetical protein